MGAYATATEVRDHPSFDGVPTVTDARIDTVMDTVERRIETYNGVAWAPRQRTDSVYGDGKSTLHVVKTRGRSVDSATIDGDAADVTNWTIDHTGLVKRNDGAFPKGSLVAVTYTHGADAPPEDLRDAAIVAACEILAKQPNPRAGPRAESVDFADGPTINWAAVPGSRENRIFGMPYVDQIVSSYGTARPVFA